MMVVVLMLMLVLMPMLLLMLMLMLMFCTVFDLVVNFNALLCFHQVILLRWCSPAVFCVPHALFSYQNKTPLKYAVEHNQPSIADFLRQHGGR